MQFYFRRSYTFLLLFFCLSLFSQNANEDKANVNKLLYLFANSSSLNEEKVSFLQKELVSHVRSNFLFYFDSDELVFDEKIDKSKASDISSFFNEYYALYKKENPIQESSLNTEIVNEAEKQETENSAEKLETENSVEQNIEENKEEKNKEEKVELIVEEKKVIYIDKTLKEFFLKNYIKIDETKKSSESYQALLYYNLDNYTTKQLKDGNFVIELTLSVYVVDRESNMVEKYVIRSIGYNKDENSAWLQSIEYLKNQIQSELNNTFNSIGSSYIIYFITDKRVVIGIGKNQKVFPGSFVNVYRKIEEKGVLKRRIIAELYVEKVEEGYSFCTVLNSTEKLLLGDEVLKVPGVGIHQDIYGNILLGSANLDNQIPVNSSNNFFIYDFILGTKFVISNSMPSIKPLFGVEILIGDNKNFDFREIFNQDIAGNFYLGMQVDWFINKFAISPFINVGLGVASNSQINKSALWFTFKGGLKFTYRFLSNFGFFIEAGYVSWVGLSSDSELFVYDSESFYRYDNLSGGFMGLGLTFYY